ncbi:alginate export family protein [Flavobacterium sp. DGU11]|uniref:Alginate export family protein n=1 Tax=Flavobacterium arundinis TaxID=3139143 RepID=A0ABU9HYF0_9FLAO
MKRIIMLITLVFMVKAAAQHPGFRPLRYDDDLSAIKSDTASGWYDKMKYLGNDNLYLSMGGELRLQYIYTVNNKWGDEPDATDGYLLNRNLFHADVHAHRFRAFAQLQSSLSAGLTDASPVDDNTVDIHQAFIDAALLSHEKASLILRAGRQELMYGSQRLIGVREGPNSRIAMDGAKLFYKQDRLQTDLFYTHPVANKMGAFNDVFNDKAKLWASYTVINMNGFFNNIDLYYLGLYKREAHYDTASGTEMRHSIGSRFWKNKGKWKYDIEGLYQFGSLSNLDISAWTISSNINYKAEGLLFKPVFGLKTEAISGDSSNTDHKLQTFNPLYPRGAYFGLVALIGPANLFDIHPSVDLELSDKWEFGSDLDIFWRWSVNDGIYAPNMQLLYAGTGTAERFIGTQLSANIEYTPDPFLNFTLESAWFNAGSFLEKSGTGKDYFYAAVTGRIRF